MLKNVEAYDTDNQAMIDWVGKQKWTNGHVGAMGFCIGGHLAFRAALNPSVNLLPVFMQQIFIQILSQINLGNTAWSVFQTFKVSY